MILGVNALKPEHYQLHFQSCMSAKLAREYLI